jgi:hypothetical protein
MTEKDIRSIKNPGQFTEEEWKESVRVIVVMKINGASASMASSGYESLEAIKYIMNILRENDKKKKNPTR